MQRVYFGMKRVMYLLRRRFWKRLRKCQIPVTPAQYEVLRILDAHDHEHGMARFALVRLLGVSGPVVSRMLGVLEERGLIERKAHERDKRAVIVTLTPFGAEATYGWNAKGPEFPEWMDRRIRKSFTSSKERANVELDLLERYLWRARYKNKETSPRLDPFKRGDVLGFWGGWLTIPPPPPLAFAA